MLLDKPNERVLLCAPKDQAASAMAAMLEGCRFPTLMCNDADDVCRQLAHGTQGAGALVLTEEVLEQPGVQELWNQLKAQPAWSELPLIILTGGGERRQGGLLDLAARAAGGLILLEHATASRTLARSVEVALRSRRRQYQVRELLEAQERKQRELENSEQLLRLVTSGTRVGLVLVNRRYEYLFANEAYREVLGLSAENLVGRRVPDILAQGWPQIQPRLDRALAGEHLNYELSLPPRLGTNQPRFFSVSYHPYRDAIGEPTVVVGVLDITSRKRAEHALREARDFDEAVMNNMAEGLYTVDNRGRVISMNPAAEKLFGWTFEELRGRKMHDVTHYKYRDGSPMPAEDCAGLRVLQEGKILRDHEDTFIRKDGSFFDVVYSSSCLREGNQITGLVVVFRDVTERKRAEDALRRALESAQTAMNAKDHFLAGVSHELRTPLTPVLMTVSMLLEEESLSPAVRTSLQMIERNVRTEVQMVNDLLDFSRIANQKLVLHVERCDLHELIRRALEVCLAGGNPKELKLEMRLEAACHHLRADTTRLSQVFWNLIQNAIKFTPAGGRITVSSHNEGQHIYVSVADTGRGIDPSLLEKIFEPFEQGNYKSKESLQGLGLGLAIARRIVAAHGGRLTAASEGIDRGAVFTVCLNSETIAYPTRTRETTQPA